MQKTYDLLSRRYGSSAATTYEYLRTKYQISATDALYQMRQQLKSVGHDPGFYLSMAEVSRYRNPDRFPTRRK